MKRLRAKPTPSKNLEDKFDRGEEVLDYFEVTKARLINSRSKGSGVGANWSPSPATTPPRCPSTACSATGERAGWSAPSEPAAHFAFQFQIRFAEFLGQISLFPQDDAVMHDQGHGNDEQQRDPVVQKESECDLQQTKRQIHRVPGETKRSAPHDR